MERSEILITVCIMTFALGLLFTPDSVASKWRTFVAEFVRPGQQAIHSTAETIRESTENIPSFSPNTAERRQIEQLKKELEASQARVISLTAQLAELHEERKRELSVPSVMRHLPRLASPSLIDAAVLGEFFGHDWRHGGFIDRGTSDGIREASLVLKSQQPLVDLGEDGEVSPEDCVLLGRSVIGKIEKVGNWTSTFLRVTDSGFRARVQVMHVTDNGFAFGPDGILKGRGEKYCRLDGISASESVRVGDEVFSADRDGISPTPLYFGRVVEASLESNDTTWRVLIEPAPIPNPLTSVEILRTSLNQARLASRTGEQN